MKIIKRIVLWVISVFMLLAALVYFPSLASAAMILTTLLTLPIDKWQELLNRIVKKKLKIILAIVLAVVSFSIAPVEDVPEDVVNNTLPSTQATTEATTLPTEEAESTAEATTQAAEVTEVETEPPTQATEPPPSSEPETEPPTEAPVMHEYDSLQTVFLSITPDTTVEELDALIADNGLCYTCKEYNKSGGGKSISYKIAYTDGAAKQSHADSGDYLKVSFDKENGRLMTAQYVKSGTVGSALLYCYGTWYDFRDSNAEDYSGYYLIDSLSKEAGITVKYDNGREVETHYFPYASAEELIQYIINLEE